MLVFRVETPFFAENLCSSLKCQNPLSTVTKKIRREHLTMRCSMVELHVAIKLPFILLIQLHLLVVLVVPFPKFWVVNNSIKWSLVWLDPWHSETHIFFGAFFNVHCWCWRSITGRKNFPICGMKISGSQKLCPDMEATNLQIGWTFDTPENIVILYHLQVPAIQFGCGLKKKSSAKNYLASFSHRGTFLWVDSYGWSWAMSPKRHTQRHLPCTLKSFPPKNTSSWKNNVPSLHHRGFFARGRSKIKRVHRHNHALSILILLKERKPHSTGGFFWTNPRSSSTFWILFTWLDTVTNIYYNILFQMVTWWWFAILGSSLVLSPVTCYHDSPNMSGILSNAPISFFCRFMSHMCQGLNSLHLGINSSHL